MVQLRGPGGTLTSPVDAAGNATIRGVTPGTYQLSMLLPAVQKAAARSQSMNNLKQMGVGVQAATGGAASGRCTLKEFSISKMTDKASPQFFKNCCSGGHVAELNRTITQGGQTFYVIELENLLISSAQSSAGSGRPMESLSLNFTKISYNY